MAKKKKKKSKGKGRGPSTKAELKGRIGANGVKEAALIQSKYSQDVVTYASRTFPKLSKKIEDGLAKMPPNKAKEIRAELLKVM